MTTTGSDPAPNTAPAPDTVPDPRPALARALTQVAGLVGAVDAPALHLPTPCDGWDVATLLAHLLSVHRRIAHVGRGGAPLDIAHTTVPEDPAPAAYVAAIAAARRDVDEVWADDAVLDRVLAVPWGTFPGRVVGHGYVQELTVHAWDLARPLGREAGLDAELAATVEATARRVVPAEPRGGHVPFGPPVPVADDAGPYARLVGWLGRDPA